MLLFRGYGKNKNTTVLMPLMQKRSVTGGQLEQPVFYLNQKGERIFLDKSHPTLKDEQSNLYTITHSKRSGVPSVKLDEGWMEFHEKSKLPSHAKILFDKANFGFYKRQPALQKAIRTLNPQISSTKPKHMDEMRNEEEAKKDQPEKPRPKSFQSKPIGRQKTNFSKLEHKSSKESNNVSPDTRGKNMDKNPKIKIPKDNTDE